MRIQPLMIASIVTLLLSANIYSQESHPMLQDLAEIAAINSKTGVDGEGNFVMSELVFADGVADVFFILGVKKITSEIRQYVKAGFPVESETHYIALLFGEGFSGSAIGKGSHVRIIKFTEKDEIENRGEAESKRPRPRVIWYGPGKDTNLTKEWPLDSIVSYSEEKELSKWDTCMCGLSRIELVNNWVKHPFLPNYFKSNPFTQ